MTNNSARIFRIPALAVLCALALGGCASDWYVGKPKEPEPNLFPANFKNEILDTITPLLTDPTNVRDAFISDPVLTEVGKDQRYAACIRYNPRDAQRRYTGNTVRIAYFFGGHLNQLVEAKPEQCSKAAYKPFPELEKLCLAKKCE